MRIAVFTLLAGLVPGLAAASTATNLNDPSIGYDTIQEALDQADPGDTIQLDGSFEESIEVAEDVVLQAGQLGGDIHSDTPLVIRVKDGARLTLDGVHLAADAPDTQLVEIQPLGGLTIRDAILNGAPSGAARPGMIRATQPGAIVLERVELLGTGGQRMASEGGGIYVATGGGNVELTQVLFRNVEASGNGGAIFAGGGVSVRCDRCVFHETKGGFGGAIHVAGSATLDLQQSLFCRTSGSLGGAIFGAGTMKIRNNRFVETRTTARGAALYIESGFWEVENNHFVGSSGTNSDQGVILATGGELLLRNNLLFASDIRALTVSDASPLRVVYNLFASNDQDSDVSLGATNITGVPPQLSSWTDDGNCANDELWPTPSSPLIDAGSPLLLDPDGSVSDIGAYGGSFADPVYFADDDGDGVPFLNDCDDTDPTVTVQSYYVDCDGDGQAALGATGTTQCFAPSDPPELCPDGAWIATSPGGPAIDSDCDDQEPLVYAGADETCDALDRNCDGHPTRDAVDARTYVVDGDGDGFGAGESFVECAIGVPGWVQRDGDCDDSDPDAWPGAPDLCGDGVDQDCDGEDGVDGELVDWYVDADGDGFGDPDRPVLACPEVGAPGLASIATDCDDTDPAVSPLGLERCNGIDDDCNDIVDDARDGSIWYADADGDGIGHDEVIWPGEGCPPDGFVALGGDCNDADPDLATECPGPEGCGGCASAGPPSGLAALGWLLLAAIGWHGRRGGR
ncbi:MAG: MopE-related protein [Myxococcota bacterium]